MCGIFGWMVNDEVLSPMQLGAMAAILGLLNDDRGGHSWGLVHGHTDPKVTKGLGEIAKSVAVDNLAANLAVMGHTRFASTGAITVENAHPFEVGDVIGAHNGIISNHTTLNAIHSRSCAVDSEHIFHHLHHGMDVKELEGWGAIEFARKSRPGSFFIGRFASGDLSIAGIGTGVDDVRGIVWSSDGRHLKHALHAAGIPFFSYQVTHGELYEVREGALWMTDVKLSIEESSWMKGMKRHERMSSSPDGDASGQGWSGMTWDPDILTGYGHLTGASEDSLGNEAIPGSTTTEDAINEATFEDCTEPMNCEACGAMVRVGEVIAELDGLRICEACFDRYMESVYE